jgi:hypothetical protein
MGPESKRKASPKMPKKRFSLPGFAADKASEKELPGTRSMKRSALSRIQILPSLASSICAEGKIRPGPTVLFDFFIGATENGCLSIR